MRFSSLLWIVVTEFRRRLRLELFFSRMWLWPLLRRLSLPFFVTSKRPATPLWVFIFGICYLPPRFPCSSAKEAHGTGVAGSPRYNASYCIKELHWSRP